MNEKNQPLCVVIKKQGTLVKALGTTLAGLRSIFVTGIIGIYFAKSALEFKEQLENKLKK